MEKKWIAISVILAIICACAVMSLPVIKVAYTVKEPYTATEMYYVTESYTEQFPLSYKSDSLTYSDEHVLDVLVTNIDDTGGEFWVTFHAIGSPVVVTGRAFLMPSESHHFKHIYSGVYPWGYNIHQTTKEVTRYHDVPKERTVTKFSDVTKYKYICAFEYLLQGET